MKNKIEEFLRGFSSCLQLAKIYGSKHPKFNASLDSLYQQLEQILADQKELVVAVVDRELASGKDIFFNLSKKLTDLVDKLIEAGFEKLLFRRGIQKSELRHFSLFLLMPQGKAANLEEYFATKKIINIEAGKIRKLDSHQERKKETALNSLDAVYSASASRLSTSLTNLIQGQSVDFTNFGLIVDGLIKSFGAYYQEVLQLSKLRGKDLITFAHTLNVSFLAVSFSRSLGFEEAISKKIGLAALFHDIGKIAVSSKIIKGKRLSDKEFEQIKTHSLLGPEILLDYVDKVGEFTLLAAFENHLRYDMTGYPKLNIPRRPHFGSMLISVCDVYDALSQRRSYKENYPPEKIYKIMKEGRGSQFHPGLLDTFFSFMGVWPSGTIVVLNNGRVAKVESQNPGNIFAPNIKIISEYPYQINLSKNEAGLRIEKSLNPYREGKRYLEEK